VLICKLHRKWEREAKALKLGGKKGQYFLTPRSINRLTPSRGKKTPPQKGRTQIEKKKRNLRGNSASPITELKRSVMRVIAERKT